MPGNGWAGGRILVTGAAGFIGSHLVEALLNGGAEVRAFLRYSSQRGRGYLPELPRDCAGRLEVFRGDLRDIDAVERAVSGREVVFHLGALISIPYSYEDPGAYFETNLRGTFNILEACRRQRTVKRCVLTSTSEVYGSARYAPMDEEHPLQAQSPYAATKIGADKLGESYWRAYGLPVVIVRPFNTYGPRQSLRAVIPQILSQLIAGDEVRLGSIAPRRDFLYVHDTVAGFLAAGSHPSGSGEVFNLGTGIDYSVGDVVRIAGELLGRQPRLQLDEGRIRPATSEVSRLQACPDKAGRVLGWRAQIDLREGLRQTAAWLAGGNDPGCGYRI